MTGLRGFSPQSILLSALKANQEKNNLNLINLAGAKLPGYVKQNLLFGEKIIGGNFAGVEKTKVVQEIDNNLTEEIRKQNSSLSYLRTIKDLYEKIEPFLGEKGMNNSLSHQAGQLSDALDAFAKDPQNQSKRAAALESLKSHVEGIITLGKNIQYLRDTVDKTIEETVEEANTLIQTIATLNNTIGNTCECLSQEGGDTSFIGVNERRQAIHDLSGLIGGRLTVGSNNKVDFYTEDSTLLIQGNVSAQLTYEKSAIVTADSELSPLKVVGFNQEIDITDSQKTVLRGGKLKALLEMRDKILFGIQEQLDEYTKNFRDTFNAISNQGASLSASSTLIGTEGVPGLVGPLSESTIISGSGTLRIGALSTTNGTLAHYYDVPLTEGMILEDFINDINNHSESEFSVSITPEGCFKVESSTQDKGIVIGWVGDEKPMVNIGSNYDSHHSYNFSHFFGLNNLLKTKDPIPSDSRVVGMAQSLSINNNFLDLNGIRLPLGTLSNSLQPTNPAVVGHNITILKSLAHQLKREDLTFNGTSVSNLEHSSLIDFSAEIVNIHATQAGKVVEKEKGESFGYEALSKKAYDISGVNLKAILQEGVELSTYQSYIVKALALSNEMEKKVLELL